MNAHVFLVADRHASNNDAVAEDVAVRRRVCMDSDSLRSEAIAVRNTEREFLALDPFAVMMMMITVSLHSHFPITFPVPRFPDSHEPP